MAAADSSVPSTSEPTTDSSTVATQRHLWQIFTDENGDVQKQSVGIVKNPFETEDSSEPTNTKNPFVEGSQGDGRTDATVGPSATLVPHQTLPPPKPQRTVNGGSVSTGKSTKVEMGGGVVVFEADKTYTRFDNVDEDQSEDDELGFTLNPKAEEHHPTSKTLIRSDSDLMLPYIHGHHGNPLTRVRRWWGGAHITIKAAVIGTLMSLTYLCVVLVIVKGFS